MSEQDKLNMQKKIINSLIFSALITLYYIFTTSYVLAKEHVPPILSKSSPQLIQSYQNRNLLKPLNYTALTEEDSIRDKQGLPYRFAIKSQLNVIANATEWATYEKDKLIWRYTISSENALHLNFGFTKYHMPNGGKLYISNPNTQEFLGPFTDQDNKSHGQLWTPILNGNEAVIEVIIPKIMLPFLKLELGFANQGYRNLDGTNQLKSGSCNIDVACSLADPWRNQVASVARISVGGESLCSGQLINNTARDKKPYFLTATHCALNISGGWQAAAATTVFYWNYENPTCRATDSSSNTSVLPLSEQTQSGASLVATTEDTAGDHTLLLLDQAPILNNAFLTGWDRVARVPNEAITIHHPKGHEKRISFENDPLGIIGWDSNLQTTVDGDSHFIISDWDLGTTEGGSSGGGLWNYSGNLIGVLTGGSAACGNNAPDYYGRLSIAWDKGNNQSSRLKDWLDPINTNEIEIEGSTACENPPEVKITSNKNPAITGDLIKFTSQVSGGTKPYSYFWDIDNNDTTDGFQNTLEVAYPQAFNKNIKLLVTDNKGCSTTATLAQSVASTNITFANHNEPSEVTGDGDNIIEPGEKWKVLYAFAKEENSITKDYYFLLSPNKAVSSIRNADSFGYTILDNQTNESLCPFNFIDISQNNDELRLMADPSVIIGGNQADAHDEGATQPINLPFSPKFNFYGSTINSLSLSTNGYLSTDINEPGGDYDNDCPTPSPTLGGGNGGRLNIFHDDLITGAAYSKHYATCPRSADTLAGKGCTIFQWNNVDLYTDTGIAGKSYNFQAIIYEGSNEIVYQYDLNDDFAGEGATIGIQNANATDGLGYRCNEQDAITQNSAICFFHPSSKPEINNGNIALEDPVISSLDSMADSDELIILEVNFIVDKDAECGSQTGIDLVGIATSNSFINMNETITSITIGKNGICNSSANNQLNNTPINFKQGIWWNPDRPGNGVDMYAINNNQIYMTWYTATENHKPTWYIILLDLEQNNYGTGEIIQFTWNENTKTTTNKSIGTAALYLLNEESAILYWKMNNKRGAELLEPQVFNLQPTAIPNRTGNWFAPSEPGWGLSINQQGDQQAIIGYLYDQNGLPTWSMGVNTVNQEDVPMLFFNVHCAGCPWIPSTSFPAGNINILYNGVTQAMVDIDINSALAESNWQRSNSNMIMLTSPQP